MAILKTINKFSGNYANDKLFNYIQFSLDLVKAIKYKFPIQYILEPIKDIYTINRKIECYLIKVDVNFKPSKSKCKLLLIAFRFNIRRIAVSALSKQFVRAVNNWY